MRNYNLNIAGYNIRIESTPDGPDLNPSERFRGNISGDGSSDILLRVHSASYLIPDDSVRTFHAPYVEEINGLKINKGEEFWSIYKHRSDLFIKTTFPMLPGSGSGVLKFSLTTREWDLYFDNSLEGRDPLEYPLDGLLLYYLTVVHGDIFIHASGINHSGSGYLFSGVSGKGKTTMSLLWNMAGGKVIHDDRLIIRNIKGKYRMFNTPVYKNDKPSESVLSRIYLIDHGDRNSMIPVKGATAVSLVMANCIQHNWSPEIIARLMGSVSIMCNTIPVIRLLFKPDRSIIDFLLDYE
jgi:hypothetical protein